MHKVIRDRRYCQGKPYWSRSVLMQPAPAKMLQAFLVDEDRITAEQMELAQLVLADDITA